MEETHPVHVLFFSKVAQILEDREKHFAVVPYRKLTESHLGATSPESAMLLCDVSCKRKRLSLEKFIALK